MFVVWQRRGELTTCRALLKPNSDAFAAGEHEVQGAAIKDEVFARQIPLCRQPGCAELVGDSTAAQVITFLVVVAGALRLSFFVASGKETTPVLTRCVARVTLCVQRGMM
jgi:hypothetical protein